MKFEPIKKPKKINIQAYIAEDLARAIERIGNGSRSGGLKIILENIKADIFEQAKKIKKAS